MEGEIDWFSSLPVTALAVPLVFVNDPTSSSDYLWPSAAEILIPNSGLHALREGHRANSAFLAAENRYCELVTTLQSMQLSDATVALMQRLFDELARLTHQKELQWVEQRPTTGLRERRLVNTGL
jgi:hypothetical protein